MVVRRTLLLGFDTKYASETQESMSQKSLSKKELLITFILITVVGKKALDKISTYGKLFYETLAKKDL